MPKRRKFLLTLKSNIHNVNLPGKKLDDAFACDAHRRGKFLGKSFSSLLVAVEKTHQSQPEMRKGPARTCMHANLANFHSCC